MTTKTVHNNRARLQSMSRALRDVHRSLIDFSRERYELANGEVHGRAKLLTLLLDDDAFTWLRPLSKLIVAIDQLAARKVPPTEADTARMGRRVEALITSADDPVAFGPRYVSLLASEPRVAMHHGELRAALGVLLEAAA